MNNEQNELENHNNKIMHLVTLLKVVTMAPILEL